MQNKAFGKFFKQLKKLTPSQRNKVESYFHQSTSAKSVEHITDRVESCPYCTSNNLHK